MLLWACWEDERYEWGYNEDIKNQSQGGLIIKWSSQPPSVLPKSHRIFGMEHAPLNYEAWEQTVEDYSARAITFAKDWPIAIQGLADIAQKLQPDDQLIWGIWKSRMPGDLLWSVAHSDHPSAHWSTFVPPDRHDGPPSWSWFSRLGQGRLVWTMRESWANRASSMAACINVEGEDKNLFPRAAIVHLRGWLVAEWMDFARSHLRRPDRFRQTKFLPILDLRLEDGNHRIEGVLLDPSTQRPSGRAWEQLKTQRIFMNKKQLPSLEAEPQEDIFLV